MNQNSHNPSVKENEEACDYLDEFDELNSMQSSITERIAFRKAAIKGLSIPELKPEDKKATSEILAVYEEMMNV